MVNSQNLTDFLPTTKKEVELRGWDELDVILFSGDAYVDHPSFGAAVIGRVLESPTVVSVQKMRIVLMGVMTADRNIQRLSIHKFYESFILTYLLY